MALISEVKDSHLSSLLSALKDMMKDEFICDFAIKVDDEEYSVHRVVLAGTSKYFNAMFSSEMKETKQGFVEMMGIGSRATKISIDFMYTGSASIDSDNVEEILSAATLMQLDRLADLCFHFLETSIEVSSCLKVVRLAEFYSRNSVQELAETFIAEHFQEVIDEPLFPEISKDNLERYIKLSAPEHDLSWKAACKWIASKLELRKSHFTEILCLLKIQAYPFDLIGGYLNKDSLFESCKDLKSALVEKWCSDQKFFLSNLSGKNYYDVKALVESYDIPNKVEIVETLSQFFLENLAVLWEHNDFLELTADEVLPVLQHTKNQYFSEEVRWKAAVKWINHDESRSSLFMSIFDCLNLNLFPRDFILKSIRKEPLTKESHHCKDVLLEFLGGEETSTSDMACLCRSTGELLKYNPIDSNCKVLTKIQGAIAITNVRSDLYVITEEKLFRLNLGGTWTKLPSPPMLIELTGTILTFQNCVYVIGKNGLQWFNPTTNVWRRYLETKHGDADEASGEWSIRTGACFAATNCALYQVRGASFSGVRSGSKPLRSMGLVCGAPSTNSVFGQPALSSPLSAPLFGSFVSPSIPQVNQPAPAFKISNTPRRAILPGMMADSLSVENRTWCAIAPMQKSRSFATSVVWRETVWVMGGGNETVEVYHPLLDIWTEISDMQKRRKKFSSCVAGDKIFVLGGSKRSSFGRTSVESYNVTTKKWDFPRFSPNISGQISCCGYSPPQKVESIDLINNFSKLRDEIEEEYAEGQHQVWADGDSSESSYDEDDEYE